MSTFQNNRILVVDDLFDNLLLLKLVLEAEGYDVETAADGQTAIAKIHESPPDLVLLDIMMPEMNGFEVTQQLRQSDDLPFIPILLITADQDVELNHSLEAGANDIIHKPIDFDELLHRVKNWCC